MNLLKYFRDRETIRNIILRQASRRKEVIYGAQANNINLPKPLRRETKDYDVLTSNPKTSAYELSKSLNKEYGEEKFRVEPAKHVGTFKVKDNENNVIADYTKTTKQPKSNNVLGIKYAKLDYSEKKIKESLKDETSSYRHEKDKDTLDRIKQSRKPLWFGGK